MAAGRRFSRTNHLRLFTTLRKLLIYLRSPSRLGLAVARPVSRRAVVRRCVRRWPPRARTPRARLAVTRLYPTDGPSVTCLSDDSHFQSAQTRDRGFSTQTSADLTHTRQASQDIHKSAVQTEKPPCLALEACGRITHLQPSVPPTPPYVAAHQHRWSRYNHSANA